MATANKRRQYFIEKSFQAKFIFKFCSLVFLAGALTTGILYCLSMRSSTVSFVNSRVVVRTTADFLLPILIQTVLIVTLFVSLATIGVTLFISHKIAGPLYHFKKAMLALGQGDFSGDFSIRSTDQLQDLASTFNNMITKTRGEIKGTKESLRSLKENLGRFQDTDLPEQKRAYLKELQGISQDLDKKIGYFKVE